MINIKITRPEPNNSLSRAKFILGIHVEPDICNPKQWVVTSWKKTYHERFDSKFEAYIWLRKNLGPIAIDHLSPDNPLSAGRLEALIRNGCVAPTTTMPKGGMK